MRTVPRRKMKHFPEKRVSVHTPAGLAGSASDGTGAGVEPVMHSGG